MADGKRNQRKNVGGRPTRYLKAYDEQAYKLCLLGATDLDIADFFGVTDRTVRNWRESHPSFDDACARGKTMADANVAESLYHRARGYSHPAVKIFMPAGAAKPVYADYEERYPPDTPACQLWLLNRQRGKWRNRHEHEHSGPNGGPIEHDVVNMTPEQRRARIDELERKRGNRASGPSGTGAD